MALGETWQPIETAPRDGRWLLLFAQLREGPRIVVGKFIDRHGQQWMIADHRCGVRKYVTYDVCAESATHWMLLPDEPEAA